MSGAVDLSVLKERADAGRAQANRPAAPTPPAGRAPAPSGGAFPAVYDVTEADFEADVVARSDQVLVLVDLWATWCEPCKQLSPTLEALASQSGGKWVLAKVDVDANPRIAQLFGVQSIPTVVAIVAGQPVSAFAGVQPAGQIQGWIDDILVKHGAELTSAPAADGAEPEPEPEDPRMIAAENKLNDGDIDGALADYKEIAAAEPGNVEAASLVRNLEFRRPGPEARRRNPRRRCTGRCSGPAGGGRPRIAQPAARSRVRSHHQGDLTDRRRRADRSQDQTARTVRTVRSGRDVRGCGPAQTGNSAVLSTPAPGERRAASGVVARAAVLRVEISGCEGVDPRESAGQ